MGLLFYTAVGFIAATFGSLVGLGGGIIIIPALVYLGPLFIGETIPVTTAVGTSLAVLVFTALSSTITFAKQRRIDFKSGWMYFLTSGPGAMLGAYVTQFVDKDSFQLSFGLFMLFMAILLIVRDRIPPLHVQWKIERSYTDKQGRTFHYGYSLFPALAIGLAVGFISGLFGIGGGSLFVPAMVLLFRYPPHVATATSMFVILLSSFMGSFTHFGLGEIDMGMVLGLAPAAILGGWCGAKIASRLSSGSLLWVLRISFVIIALKMILEGLHIL